MENDRKKISLIVNGCIIKLKNGNTIVSGSYRSSNQGIYVVTDNSQDLFHLYAETEKAAEINAVKKLAYIPFDQIDVILYDIEQPAAPQTPPPAPTNPVG